MTRQQKHISELAKLLAETQAGPLHEALSAAIAALFDPPRPAREPYPPRGACALSDELTDDKQFHGINDPDGIVGNP